MSDKDKQNLSPWMSKGDNWFTDSKFNDPKAMTLPMVLLDETLMEYYKDMKWATIDRIIINTLKP